MYNRISLRNEPKKYKSNMTVVNEGNATMWLSYGYYPIVIKDSTGKIFVNEDKVSPTTSKQTTMLLRSIGGFGAKYVKHSEMIELSERIGF